MNLTQLIQKATQVVQILTKAGHIAYFAGGCVRDHLLGYESQDIDIASSATPEEVKAIFPKTIPVGEQFGVMIVVQGEHHFEVATFRSDGSYEDGRRPEGVTFVTPKEDAKRRDFTINGMFYDPLEEKIIDFVEGRKDLEQGIIRAIGNPEQRFEEDKLRMLRAIRFAARFDYPIETETFKAIKQFSQEINVVSMERIREELIKILRGFHRGLAMQLLHDSQLLLEILPEIAAMDGVKQDPEYHPEGDVFVHTKLMLDLLPDNPSTALAFGALFHDVGKPPTYTNVDHIHFYKHEHVGGEMTKVICKRLKFSNEDSKNIVLYVSEHTRFGAAMQMREGKLKKMLQRETIQEELTMLKADCEASHHMMETYEFCKNKLANYREEELRPALFVSGKRLLEWGYKPSAQFTVMIESLEEMQLEGSINSLEEAKEHVIKTYPCH